MADAPDADQKTEAPTAKRRRESAEKGHVLQSRELGTLLVIGAGVAWVMTGGPALVAALGEVLRAGLTLGSVLDAPLRDLAAPLASFAALAMGGAIAGSVITGPHFSAKAIAPQAGRLNPLAGLKRMFGVQAGIELGKALLKALLLFGTGYAVLAARIPALLALGVTDPGTAGARMGGTLTALLVALVAALTVIAALDLPLQIVRHLAKLRMSKQEVREESRESEGSPETKAAQRRQARSAAKRALAPAMADATVVVVNPAHFAVALRYVPGRDAAPVVVAKGRDIIAAAIRDLAAEKTVPVLAYPQLTRAIFFTAKVGETVQAELFAAVAAVLAFVFSLDAQARRDQPDVEVPDALRFDADGRRAL